MRTFFELFARSPFEPLLRHAEGVQKVVEQVRPLVDAFLDGRWDEVQTIHERISRLEHEADKVKQEIRAHLPRSLFLPVDRGDLLSFLKEQDEVADSVEDLAVLMAMRERTRVPAEMRDSVMALVDQVLETLEVWYVMSSALQDLQESSFTGPEVTRVMEMIQELHTLEWHSDQAQESLSHAIVRQEDDLGAVSVLFLMRITSKLGQMANHAENAADRLSLMLAKS